MTDIDNPQDGLPGEDVSEEVSTLYKSVKTDADRTRVALAFSDGVHQDSTARDYKRLLDCPTQDLSREEILQRDFFQYGSTLKAKDDVELIVQYMREADRDRSK